MDGCEGLVGVQVEVVDSEGVRSDAGSKVFMVAASEVVGESVEFGFASLKVGVEGSECIVVVSVTGEMCGG